MPTKVSIQPVAASIRVKPLVRALMLAGMSAPLAAFAQQASETASGQPDPSVTELNTIVVTAGKRAEKQREVAGSVSVLEGGELERLGVVDQEGAFKLTPGVQVNKGDPGTNNITIRGLTTQAATEGGGNQQQPTGFYLEDVPLNAPAGKGLIMDVLPFDLERIEVLRGPQGALFGSGSLGGAVRYLYAKPDLDYFNASLMGSVSSVAHGDSAMSGFGMVNMPLAEGVAGLRVVAFDRNDPGYIDNLGTGRKDANKVHQSGGRALLTVKPTDAFKATLVVSSERTNQADRFYVSPDPERFEHNAPSDGKAKSRFDFASLTMDYDVGDHTLTSITGYWDTESKGRGDDTELFASIGLVLPEVSRPFELDGHATSQELRIANNPGGPLNYVAGVFYQTSSFSSLAQQIATGGSAIFGTDMLVDLTTSSGGTEAAAFFDGEYVFDNGWSLGLGGRYYRTTTRYRQDGFVFGSPSQALPPDGKDNGVTPKLSVKYRFGEDNLWYALATKGYRYGGVNAMPPFATYQSDSLWNYETGVRLTPAKGLQLDLTAFLLDWKDAQFTYFDDSSAIPFAGIGNVGQARSTGLEVSARYVVNPSFDIMASAAYTDAKTTAAVVTGAGQSIASGSRLPGTARLQTALQANARFTGPFDSRGTFSALHTHLGDRVTDLGGAYVAPAFSTLDLDLSFLKNQWTLSANLANVFDELGILSRTGSPALATFGQYYLQRPRTLTFSVRYDY